jgi:hypothetical protein
MQIYKWQNSAEKTVNLDTNTPLLFFTILHNKITEKNQETYLEVQRMYKTYKTINLIYSLQGTADRYKNSRPTERKSVLPTTCNFTDDA